MSPSGYWINQENLSGYFLRSGFFFRTYFPFPHLRQQFRKDLRCGGQRLLLPVGQLLFDGILYPCRRSLVAAAPHRSDVLRRKGAGELGALPGQMGLKPPLHICRQSRIVHISPAPQHIHIVHDPLPLSCLPFYRKSLAITRFVW